MLPLVLSPVNLRAGLAGKGTGLQRRAAFLEGAGVKAELLSDPIGDAELSALRLLFLVGLGEEEAKLLAKRAHALGVLVNVEDIIDLCDFHVPAVVRRGELLLAISTGGRAPGLARYLRERLAGLFGPEWRDHVQQLSTYRATWKEQGLSPTQISQNLRELITRSGWL